MPSKQHKRWSDKKNKLDAGTLKALGKRKLDFGKTLDEFDKYSTLLTKELGTGDKSKKASGAVDALRKLRTSIDTTRTEYTKILVQSRKDLVKTDPKAAGLIGEAETVLRGIGMDIESELKMQLSAYGDVAQRNTNFTLDAVFGAQWVAAIGKLKFANTSAFQTFATHPAFTLSPTDGTTPDPTLTNLQKEFAKQLKAASTALTVLKEGTKKTYTTQKDAYLFARKAVNTLAEHYGVPNGAISIATEWRGAVSERARGTNYDTSAVGKTTLKTFDTISKLWQPTEENILNQLDGGVDAKRF